MARRKKEHGNGGGVLVVGIIFLAIVAFVTNYWKYILICAGIVVIGAIVVKAVKKQKNSSRLMDDYTRPLEDLEENDQELLIQAKDSTPRTENNQRVYQFINADGEEEWGYDKEIEMQRKKENPLRNPY